MLQLAIAAEELSVENQQEVVIQLNQATEYLNDDRFNEADELLSMIAARINTLINQQ